MLLFAAVVKARVKEMIEAAASAAGAEAFWGDVEVRAGERMTFWAMSFTGIQGGWADTAQDIDFIGDGFEVERVDTGAITAKVVELQAGRDRANGVGEGIDVAGSVLWAGAGDSEVEFAIAGAVEAPSPEPTAILEYLDAAPEAFRLGALAIDWGKSDLRPCSKNGG